MPGEGEEISSQEYARFQKKCDFCHGMVAEDHYSSIDPLSDLQLRDATEGLNLVLIDGEYSCFSCHDPHDEQSEGLKLLKKDYLDLAANSKLINPHWKNVMCVTCHTARPEKGHTRLRMEGDVIALCNRCHDGEVASAFLHPVGIEPSTKVQIPEGMPLTEGLITCQTCHKSSLQETGENIRPELRSNPGFLRVQDWTPGEFCRQCHIEDEYSKINVHKQLDEEGEIRTAMCAGCHFVLPEDSGEATISIETKFDPREYCLLCHKEEIYMKNHPAGPHLVEPSRDIYYALLSAEKRIGAPLPLYEDRITCSTCHDSHEKGVLKRHDWIESESGTRGMGVRAEYREILCTGCHD
jgi:predicted CXXCH cytochrome family protein